MNLNAQTRENLTALMVNAGALAQAAGNASPKIAGHFSRVALDGGEIIIEFAITAGAIRFITVDAEGERLLVGEIVAASMSGRPDA